MRATEFMQGVSEGWRENLAAAGIAGALATATPAQAQAQPTVSADPIVATVVIDGEQRRLDLSAKNFGDVREAERWLAKFMRDRGIRDWQGKIERGEPGSGRYQRITIQGAGGLDERRITEITDRHEATGVVVIDGYVFRDNNPGSHGLGQFGRYTTKDPNYQPDPRERGMGWRFRRPDTLPFATLGEIRKWLKTQPRKSAEEIERVHQKYREREAEFQDMTS